MPGIKKAVLPLNAPIVAGGINVYPGDIIVADEEGVAVIPKEKAEDIYSDAKQRVEEEAAMGLEKWAENHRKKIDSFYNTNS